MNRARCRIHRLGFKDLERAVDDPVLADLMQAGWTVIAPVAVEDRGEQQVVLILAPPPTNTLRSWIITISIGLITAVGGISAYLLWGA